MDKEELFDFNRNKIAAILLETIESNSISSLLIDGEWGIGKTAFSNNIITLLEKKKSNICIYFDAFKADHTNEPLLALFSTIAAKLPSKNKKSFIERSIPILQIIALGIAKSAMSKITKQYTDEILDSISETAQEKTTNYIESLIKNYSELETNIKSVKKLLAEISAQHPLYIFIDELDRCKPDFSISIIEIIKHLFDVVNVTFIFIANTSQIYAALQHKYGLSYQNSKKYLDKFFQYHFKLPTIMKDTDNKTTQLAKQLFLEKIAKFPSNEQEKLRYVFAHLIEHNVLSLRDVNKLFLNLEINKSFGGFSDHGDKFITYLYLFIIFIQVFFQMCMNISRKIIIQKK